jgi:glycine cleavage system aminomethyltransferase T
VMEYSFGRQNWFENHAAEHRAARERVAIFDQTGFAKLTLKVRDALPVLQRLCGNDVDVAPGRLVYTGMFNERGGTESDLTILRLAEDEYFLVTGTAQGGRDADWIQRNIAPGQDAVLSDVTGAYGVLGVMGPDARVLLGRVSDADLTTGAFPFGTAQSIAVGRATARALRITYVGELGWELHVPVEQMGLAYEALMDAGRELGVANAGHYAINSLRLEKGYRAWGAELSPEDTPLEAGLGFVVAWDKKGGFIGRDALLRQKEKGLTRQLLIFVLEDPEPVLWGSEPILMDGRAVGYTTSGSYGFTVGGGIAMGYVKDAAGIHRERLAAARFEINVSGQRVPARAHFRCPYDPDRKRILV